MTERRKPGRPRKWASDAERMRAKRAAQRADRERSAEEQRTKVLGGVEPTDPDEAAREVDELPHAETVLDVERLIDLLMIACRVEGGIHEWLHQSCIEEQDQLLTALRDEQEFSRSVMDEAKTLDRTNRLLRERLAEVDPNGPLRISGFVTNQFPELKES